MAAPKGNRNAVKGAPWRDAIDRAMKRVNKVLLTDETGQQVRKDLTGRQLMDIAVLKLLVAAAEGDLEAIKELANRLDGRPGQRVEVAVDNTATERMLEAEERLRRMGAGSFSAELQSKLMPDDMQDFLQ